MTAGSDLKEGHVSPITQRTGLKSSMTAADGLKEGDFPVMHRNKLKRMPERGLYDRETVFKILDETFICHLGYTFEGRQYVMPQAFALDKQKQKLYFHGSITNRMLKTMKVSRTRKSRLIRCCEQSMH